MWFDWCEELTHWKRPWCWERLKAGKEGNNRRWDGWIPSLPRWTWIWASSASWWWTRNLAYCSLWSHKELDMTDWTELMPYSSNIWCCIFYIKKMFFINLCYNKTKSEWYQKVPLGKYLIYFTNNFYYWK